VVFEVEKLSRPPLFEGITFKLRAGEVLGLAGLVGAGRSEFARAAFGLYRSTGGLMKMHGRSYAPTSPSDARRAGVVYLPEERKRQGFVLSHSLRAGISIGLLNQLSRFGWVRHREERNTVSTAAERYRVKHHSIEQPVGTLSGGNQQKALLARWLETNPDLIILDEPTRGVDVGAKAEIHRLILALAGEGRAVLLISSDLPELLSLSDRILVLHRGRMAAEVSAQNTTQEEILVAASGLTVTSRQ
jgi:ABC-type sugar transport system ATPase subunit